MNDSSKLTPAQRQEQRVLKLRGYAMAVKSRWHWKYGDVNYFYTTGTITIDPNIKYKKKGFDALIELLEKRYPKRPQSVVIP